LLENHAKNVIKRISKHNLSGIRVFKPDIWVTYHLYYKAPYLIGP
jgi:hypothetical protein